MIIDLEQRAYHHIRQGVLRGALKPGQRVSEAETARELRISRTPVRHAIRQLESEGLIEQVARSGTYIRALSEQDIVQMWQLRQALEVMAVAIAVHHISRDQLAQLHQHVQEFHAVAQEAMRRRASILDSALMDRLVKADALFHTVLLQAAGNPRFLKIFANLHLLATLVMSPATKTRDASREVMRLYLEHARIYRAVKRGDSGAAQRCMAQSLGRWDQPDAIERARTSSFYIGEWSASFRDWLIAHDEQILRLL
jgi:DNA-binding GntR family transcriptional regulator